MGRIGIWAANALLFVLCCYLVAGLINQVAAELLVPASLPTAAAVPTEQPVVARSGNDRKVILDRNLFNVSTVVNVRPQAAAADEQLEATKLPLKLLGTAASADVTVSWAAVEDLESRAHVVVKVNDTLKQKAKVLRIERRRIVLENGGRREELALDDGPPGGANTRQARGRRQPPANLVADDRIRKLGENRFEVPKAEVENALNNPAQLFTQARILPKYQDGQMIGVQLNAVKPGSLFEQLGIQSGDTITVLNGIEINSPEKSTEVLQRLVSDNSISVTVIDSSGNETQKKLDKK